MKCMFHCSNRIRQSCSKSNALLVRHYARRWFRGQRQSNDILSGPQGQAVPAPDRTKTSAPGHDG